MSETPVNTSNYFTAALQDDQQCASASASASGSSTPLAVSDGGVETKEDRAARKARRIAEAVERSKKEYTADNVYTERGWFLQNDDRGVSKSKIDQQRLEFLTASLYYSPNPDHGLILSKILHALNEDRRPGLFPKELLDIGIRSALATGQTATAAKLARTGSSSWAGAACTAYDALSAHNDNDAEGEAVIPLLSCISVGGPQYPLLTRLAEYLTLHHGERGGEQVTLLRNKVDDLTRKKGAGATRSMFEDEEGKSAGRGPAVKCPDREDIDSIRLFEEMRLAEEYRDILGAAVRKLEKATRSADEPPAGDREERGVREL